MLSRCYSPVGAAGAAGTLVAGTLVAQVGRPRRRGLLGEEVGVGRRALASLRPCWAWEVKGGSPTSSGEKLPFFRHFPGL